MIINRTFGLLVITLCLANGAAAEPDASPLTLADCFALALKQSETIAIKQELLKETEGRFLLALSQVLPRASYEWSKKRQDGAGGSAFTLRDVPEQKFVFSQPLFSGFKEFAAMAGSRAERRQRNFERSRAEQLLFVDVADAFHLLLQQEEELRTLELSRAALSQRIDELRERARLGRSRPSEVASADAQLRRVEAEIELLRSQAITARQLMEFLTGRAPLGPLADRELSLPLLADEATYTAKASGRADVRAAEEAWRVATQEVGAARADFFPDVDLEGNYYTRRVGSAAGVDWDVLLKVNVPLFQGGETVGAVREASSKARQVKLQYERVRREAVLDIRDAHATLQGARARLAAIEQALDAAEASYRLQAEDYRVNLVNNLDVLQSLQQLQDARREAIRARHEAKRRYWQLLAASGNTL